MRGEDRRSEQLFSYVNLEARIPSKHPLRRILALADDALRSLSGEFFGDLTISRRLNIDYETLIHVSVETIMFASINRLVASLTMR